MRSTIDIFGVAIDDVDTAETLRYAREFIRAGTPHQICTPNVEHIILVRRDRDFRRVIEEADLVVPDGMPIVWMSRWNGTPLRERVTGSDTMPALCAVAAEEGYSIYLLGAEAGVGEEVAKRLRERHPALRIAGISSPPVGFEKDEAHNREEIDKVRTAKPDILFVALGSPKQEKWINRHLQDLGVPVAMGVGAAFNFIAGREKRAPVWMQRVGLESIYRTVRYPRKRLKRMLGCMPHFIFMLIDLRSYGLRKRLLHLLEFLGKAIGDAAMVAATFWLSIWLRFQTGLFGWFNELLGREVFPPAPWTFEYFLQFFAFLTLVTVLFLGTQRLYDRHLEFRKRDIVLRIGRGWTLAILALLAFGFLGGQELRQNLGYYARSTLVLTYVAGGVLLIGWRMSLRVLRNWLRSRKFVVDRVIVLGADESHAGFFDEIQAHPKWGVQPVAILNDDPAMAGRDVRGVPVLGPLSEFFAVARSRKVDVAVVIPDTIPGEQLAVLAAEASRAGIGFALLPNDLALLAQQTFPSVIGGRMVLRMPR